MRRRDPDSRCEPCSYGKHVNHILQAECTIEGCACPVRTWEESQEDLAEITVPRFCDDGCTHTETCDADYADRVKRELGNEAERRKKLGPKKDLPVTPAGGRP